jgi:hypothetical protein
LPATTVFVSYASDIEYWKENFTDKTWFINMLGNVKVVDYKMGDNLPFGSLNKWLEDEIDSAGAIVLIVSKDYVDKKYTLREWWQGLTPQNRGRLVFVPVLIDAEAKDWWASQKKLGKLRALGEDYVYADFTEGGKPVNIVGPNGRPITEITHRISELARLIRLHLEEARVFKPSGGTSAVAALDPVSEVLAVAAPGASELVAESPIQGPQAHPGEAGPDLTVPPPPPGSTWTRRGLVVGGTVVVGGTAVVAAAALVFHKEIAGPRKRDEVPPKRLEHGTEIEIYAREDAQKVKDSLYPLTSNITVNDTLAQHEPGPSNVVWYSPDVLQSDAKLVAETLLEAGIGIMTIRPIDARTLQHRRSQGRSTNLVQVGINARVKLPVLTLEDVRTKSLPINRDPP